MEQITKTPIPRGALLKVSKFLDQEGIMDLPIAFSPFLDDSVAFCPGIPSDWVSVSPMADKSCAKA